MLFYIKRGERTLRTKVKVVGKFLMYFKVIYFFLKKYVGFFLRNIPLHSPLKHSHTLAPLTETGFLN